MTQHSAPSTQHEARNEQVQVDAPPILRTWRRLYTAVLLSLGAEIVLFYVLTRAFF
jgi:hypothetical protein